jgi:alkane 1-monooxygenase
MDFTLYFYILWGITTGRLGKTLFEFAVYVIGGAILGATNTTAGHELFHKRQTVHKIFGIMPWFKMLSGHLYMYHLQLHHKYAGHPIKDPSLPHYNQSIYSYCSYNSIKAYIVTYQYEEKRLAKRKSEYSAFNVLAYNRVILFNIIHVLYLALLYFVCGPKTMLFQILYAFSIVMLVDSTNYVEHYGLKLKQLNKDKPNEEPVYESVSRQVSWDALQPLSSAILFKL